MAQITFLFDEKTEEIEFVETQKEQYTKKRLIPQYEPKGTAPCVHELCDMYKYYELVKEIKEANDITDEERKFLLLASTRHLGFNYDKIAEYYARADKKMQELMEKNALVLIDYDDAIAYGYTKLANDMDKMSEEDYYGGE